MITYEQLYNSIIDYDLDFLKKNIDHIDINMQNTRGDSLLVVACRFDLAVKEMLKSQHFELNDTSILKFLLSHPNIDVNLGDMCGITPLMQAIILNQYIICELLLQHPNIDIYAKDNEGYDAVLLLNSRYCNCVKIKSLVRNYYMYKPPY